MRTDVDLVVAGLGVLGAATAAAAARRGLSVIALDRHRPPHSLGSSHGDTRIIRRVYSEGSLYVPLVDRAYLLWRELERRTGQALLLPRGGLFLGDRDSEMVAGALACAREHGLEHEPLDTAQIRRRFPALAPPRGVTAVFDPAAGVLRPERCVEALLGEAAGAGAELRFDCALDGWSSAVGGVRIDCDGAALRTRALVLATGGWLAAAGGAPGGKLVVERQVQHWFAPATGAPAAVELPPFVWQLSAERTWYGLPDLGQGLKAALHHGGEPTTAGRLRRDIDRADVEEVRQLIARYLPGAAGRRRRSAVCMYTNTPDLRFLAGPLPADSGVWVLGGGSGHAFKFAPALGELVVEGVTAGDPPPELDPFRPGRFVFG